LARQQKLLCLGGIEKGRELGVKPVKREAHPIHFKSALIAPIDKIKSYWLFDQETVKKSCWNAINPKSNYLKTLQCDINLTM
jgi:hypothetical protein